LRRCTRSAWYAAMRILLVSSGSGSRGGGEIFIDYLGQGLAVRGHEVLTWIPEHPRMDELAEKCARFARVIRTDYCNTYDHKVRSLSTCFNEGVSRQVARQWASLKPDVIHVNKQNLEDGLDLLRASPSVCSAECLYDPSDANRTLSASEDGGLARLDCTQCTR